MSRLVTSKSFKGASKEQIVNINSQSVFKHWRNSRVLKECKGCATIEKKIDNHRSPISLTLIPGTRDND